MWLDEIQRERAEWSSRNFPNLPIEEAILGVIEELGELAHHQLKEQQGIRTNEDHIIGATDAVGDLVIYLLGVCTHGGFTASDAITAVDGWRIMPIPKAPAEHLLALSYWVGNLAQHPSPGSWHTGCILMEIATYCEVRNWNFKSIVQSTWTSVQKRDWVANKETGEAVHPSIQGRGL